MGITRDELWNLRLSDARTDIAASLRAETYSAHDLEALLTASREDWRFPGTIHSEFFIDYLVRTQLLRKRLFVRENSRNHSSYPIDRTIYAAPSANVFDISLGLRRTSYLSHLSAASLHGLTELVPRVVFTNLEQSEKSRSSATELEQEPVSLAFSKSARVTDSIYSDGITQVSLLTGKHTGRLEVFDTLDHKGKSHPATSLERTLIDCAVRPEYAGGVYEVLAIYESARDKVSVRRLRKALKQLDFVYPYRQVIGFLLERSGYSEQLLSSFESPGFKIDFYLKHAMSNIAYSKRWRLYYPKGF